MKKTHQITFVRNLLITGGFYGLYYAVIQFLTLLWRKAFVLERVFTGGGGQILSWFLWDFPFWLFCVVSGFVLPYVVESRAKFRWSVGLGVVFALNGILFTTVHWTRTPTLLESTLTRLSWLLPVIFCLAGTLLQDQREKRKARTG